MARSILPSTSRRAAADRAFIHRATRRSANAATRELLKDPASWDDGADAPDEMQLEIGPMVRWRRGRDKLNHFERWAVKRTREMPADLRLGHLAGVLPPGLIGDHAYGHLEQRPELMSEAQYRLRFPWRFSRRYRRFREYLDRGEAAVLLRRVVLSPDGHRALNGAIKATVAHELARRHVRYPVRTLRGLHDVLPFLEELEHWKLVPLRRTVDAFLRQLKR